MTTLLPHRPALALLLPLVAASAAGACGSSKAVKTFTGATSTASSSGAAATSGGGGASSGGAGGAASGGSGGASSGGTGGAASATSSSSKAASSGAVSAASSSSGGTGGSKGTGGAGGCSAGGGLNAVGMVNGKAYTLQTTAPDADLNAGFGVIVVGKDGLLVFSGPASPPMGQQSQITGFFLTPSGGADASSWFVMGAGSTLTPGAGATISFSLVGLRELGGCPQATGAGSLAFCLDTKGASCSGADSSTTGMLDLMSLDWSGGLPNAGNDGKVTYVDWPNGAVLAVLLNGPFAVTNGLLLTPSSGPDPDAYYCVGSTSTSGFTQNFGNFVRLGTAAQGTAAGSLDACYAP